jgi:hypothetical protein
MSWVHPQYPHAFGEIRNGLYHPDVPKRSKNLHAHDQAKNALAIYDYESFLKNPRTK